MSTQEKPGADQAAGHAVVSSTVELGDASDIAEGAEQFLKQREVFKKKPLAEWDRDLVATALGVINRDVDGILRPDKPKAEATPAPADQQSNSSQPLGPTTV